MSTDHDEITAVCSSCGHHETTNNISEISTSTGACRNCGGHTLHYQGEYKFDLIIKAMITRENTRRKQ